jgi:hypothetical protein
MPPTHDSKEKSRSTGCIESTLETKTAIRAKPFSRSGIAKSGYLAHANDPPPGNAVIWHGLTCLTEIELGAVIGATFVDN